jgi:hypothetical protein
MKIMEHPRILEDYMMDYDSVWRFPVFFVPSTIDC